VIVASVCVSRSYLHALLGLHRLVQPVAPAPARHLAARELVDDQDTVILYDILHIALVETVGTQQLGAVVDALVAGHEVGLDLAAALGALGSVSSVVSPSTADMAVTRSGSTNISGSPGLSRSQPLFGQGHLAAALVDREVELLGEGACIFLAHLGEHHALDLLVQLAHGRILDHVQELLVFRGMPW
jgi:hypothetical protein